MWVGEPPKIEKIEISKMKPTLGALKENVSGIMARGGNML